MDTRQPEKLETLFWGPSRYDQALQVSVERLTAEIESQKKLYTSFHSDLQNHRLMFQEFKGEYLQFQKIVQYKLNQISDILGSSASGDEERYNDMPDILERLEDLEESMKRLRIKKGYF
jgi:hypothetical protein